LIAARLATAARQNLQSARDAPEISDRLSPVGIEKNPYK
jgi:hypothetical protein